MIRITEYNNGISVVNRMTRNIQTEQKIKDTINVRFHSIEMVYQNFRNNPYSKDYVHRLRVELRKLRAILSFLKPILDRKEYNLVNQKLKSLGQKLSKKRDLDTLIDILEDTAEKEALLIYNYADIFGYLEKERLEESNLIGQKDAIFYYDSILNDTKSMLNSLAFNLDKKKYMNLDVFIVNRIKQKSKKLKNQYKKINLTNYDQIHELRKDAKKVRYAAVGFKRILPKKLKSTVKKEAKHIQEDLGSKTDHFVTTNLLKQYSKSTIDPALQNAFRQLIDYYN